MPNEALAERVGQLKECLNWSDKLVSQSGEVLDNFQDRLAKLSSKVKPVTDRALQLATARDHITRARDKADEVSGYLDTSRRVQGIIQRGPKSDLDGYIRALQKLDAAIEYLMKNKNYHTAAAALKSATSLQAEGLSKCHQAFAAELKQHSTVPKDWVEEVAPTMRASSLDLAPPGRTSSDQLGPSGGQGPAEGAAAVSFEALQERDVVPPPVLSHLHRLAEVTLASNSLACYNSYVDVRRGQLERALQNMSSEVASKEEFSKITWPVLERKVQRWSQGLMLTVVTAIAEATLSRGVFEFPRSSKAYSEVLGRPMGVVGQVGDLILHCRRLPEKVLALLDMASALDTALPLLHHLAQEGSPVPGAKEVERLGPLARQEARETLHDLETYLAKEIFKHNAVDGSVNPTTAFALSHLKRLLAHPLALPTLFHRNPDLPQTPIQARRDREELEGEARQAVVRVLDSLVENLEAKAASFRTRPLAAIFLMNNLHFLVKGVEASEALRPPSPAWMDTLRKLIEKQAQEYKSSAWGPLLTFLKEDADQFPSFNKDKFDKNVLKEKFRQVNELLDGLFKVQSKWSVPDAGLKRSLKEYVQEAVVPQYEAFLKRYEAISFTKNKEKYFRYTAMQLRQAVTEDLFEAVDEYSGPKPLTKRDSRRHPSLGN